MEELWGSMGLGWESSLVFDPNWLTMILTMDIFIWREREGWTGFSKG